MAKQNSKLSKKKIIASLRAFIRSKGQDYLKDGNVTSIGVGYKIKDGIRTDEITIQFTVGTKLEADQLESIGTTLIPSSIEIDGISIPTDVIQRSYILSYSIIQDIVTDKRKEKIDPIQPGISISNVNGTAGTLGCIVYDKINETPYVLSNWHVLHGLEGVIGDQIVQPGPADDNRTHLNNCGKLVRSYLGIGGDCALSSIENRSFKEDILNLATTVKEISDPDLDDRVVKSGRTTEITYGIVVRTDVITKINYGGNIGVKEIGCFEIGIDPSKLPVGGEISDGGDSGSAWMILNSNNKPSNIMAGLHFAGEAPSNPLEYALACYPKSVFKKLGIKTSKSLSAPAGSTLAYNPRFLGSIVNVPRLNNLSVAFKLNGSEIIDYVHFSLAMHKTRRMAIYVAWNIDGSSIKKLSRSNISFKTDPRIPASHQVGETLYSSNNLDRGHIARRADLLWGSLTEAQKANTDSFYFTNITPQMNDFNQSGLGGIWGKLEDAVFNDVDVENLKVSVIGGPVFRDDDRTYRKIKIPREFYKVLFYKVDGILKSKAFLLTQNLDNIESLDLESFKVFEISLGEVEQRCNFHFDESIKTFLPEIVMGDLNQRKPILSLEEIKW